MGTHWNSGPGSWGWCGYNQLHRSAVHLLGVNCPSAIKSADNRNKSRRYRSKCRLSIQSTRRWHMHLNCRCKLVKRGAAFDEGQRRDETYPARNCASSFMYDLHMLAGVLCGWVNWFLLLWMAADVKDKDVVSTLHVALLFCKRSGSPKIHSRRSQSI